MSVSGRNTAFRMNVQYEQKDLRTLTLSLTRGILKRAIVFDEPRLVQ